MYFYFSIHQFLSSSTAISQVLSQFRKLSKFCLKSLIKKKFHCKLKKASLMKVFLTTLYSTSLLKHDSLKELPVVRSRTPSRINRFHNEWISKASVQGLCKESTPSEPHSTQSHLEKACALQIDPRAVSKESD